MAHLFDSDEEHEDKQKLVTDLVESDDVIAAVKYVAALPDVDPKRVATIGCSFGGIESVFAAEQGDWTRRGGRLRRRSDELGN